MTYILGISALYHDSAAALIRDDEIIAAAQEERFTRIKHDRSFPHRAIEYCLKEANISIEQLSGVIFYEKPFRKFERILETYLAFAPKGFLSFLKAMPAWLHQKLHTPREIDAELGDEYDGPIYFIAHHESHAASAFFPSPFEEAAILIVDGVGEWATTSWGIGQKNRIQLRKEIQFPHSLGLLYAAFTYYLGFKVNSGEHKLMGLAPYGRPVYADKIMANLLDLKDDGSFWLDQRYFNYCAGLTMTNHHFHELFGGPPRQPEAEITTRHTDVAASIQKVTEEILLRIVQHIYDKTGLNNLCIAGGVALNCVANALIATQGPFKRIWLQPAAGDAGGALGSALYAWHQILGNPRRAAPTDSQQGSYLGPSIDAHATRDFLDGIAAKYHQFDSEAQLCDSIAELLAAGKIVGHVAGRMEFGPRALGHRSILADPRNPHTRELINSKVKYRESFRPFAPACLDERASAYFDIGIESPYMLLTAPVTTSRRKPLSDEEANLTGFERLGVIRSEIPAVTHVDYSARIQTVSRDRSPRYYDIIRAFEKKTGCATVLNTSLNIRGEPIVCTAEEGYQCFMFTEIDALVLEDVLCLRHEQPLMEGADQYREQFAAD